MSIAEAKAAYLDRNDEAALDYLKPLAAESADDLTVRHLLALIQYRELYESLQADRAQLVELTGVVAELYADVLGMLRGAASVSEADIQAFTVLAAEMLYVTKPELRERVTAFNGQGQRRALFGKIIAEIKPTALFETGTQFGATTEFLASDGNAPVYSTEIDFYLHAYAALRLKALAEQHPDVTKKVGLFHLDALEFLKLALSETVDTPVFFYLDHHTDQLSDRNLLKQELAMISQYCRRAIVLIDDVIVPDDPSYTGTSLDAVALDRLSAVVSWFDAAYLPALASDESGDKRGSLLLSVHPDTSAILDSFPELRRYQPA